MIAHIDFNVIVRNQESNSLSISNVCRIMEGSFDNSELIYVSLHLQKFSVVRN